MPDYLDKALSELASEMVGRHHGEGYIAKSNVNYKDYEPQRSRRHQLEVWVMDDRLPGTYADVKLVYLCAINSLGSITHVILDKDASYDVVQATVEELWENRYWSYISALNDHKARVAEIRAYGRA